MVESSEGTAQPVTTSVLSVNLPEEVVAYREDIRRFLDAMIYKLRLNAHKGRWENDGVEDRLPKLLEEFEELKEAVEGGNMIETLLEAADVANFAMIIAAIAVERGK